MRILTLHFSNLLLAGLLAGCEVGVHFGVGSPPTMLGDTAQIQIRQAVGRRLRILVPALFLPTAITGIIIAIMQSRSPGALLRWVAILSLAVWIFTRAVVTVPVNSAMLDWSAASPPANWRERITLAQYFHVLGVWASVIAFGGFLAADLLLLRNW